MITFPIQYVLLAAIAFSQVFGGVSCCCLGGVLSGVFPANSSASHQDGNASAGDVTDDTACPNCVVKKSKPSQDNHSRSQGSLPCASSEGDSCDCEKLSIDAYTTSETGIARFDFNAWSVLYFLPLSLGEAITFELRFYEAPTRFCGRSWQSLASIWMN